MWSILSQLGTDSSHMIYRHRPGQRSTTSDTLSRPTMATAAAGPCRRRPPMTNRTTRAMVSGGTVMAVIALAAAVVCAAVTGTSAITTKPSATAVIKTTLQISPPTDDKTTAKPENRQQLQQPSFAARYWVSDNLLVAILYRAPLMTVNTREIALVINIFQRKSKNMFIIWVFVDNHNWQ